MLVSELLMGLLMGSLAVFLCLCLLTTSIVLYIRRKQSSIRLYGVPKWLQQGSDAVSECEKGGVESVGLLEVYEKEWGSEVTEKLPTTITDYARHVDVKTTYEAGCVKEAILIDTSEEQVESVNIQERVTLFNKDGSEQYIDPIALQHVYKHAVSRSYTSVDQPSLSPYDDNALEDFDFDQFLQDAEEFPTLTPADEDESKKPIDPITSKPQRPRLPLARKSKRSWDTSSHVDANFGSMQVKGIRDVREDRPKPGSKETFEI